MSTRALLENFTAWSAATDALVLVTVTETAGSTYSKAGQQLLMQPDGRHAGLISGGCLEGDLLSHAQQVFETGKPVLVTYDMRDDADDLWGIGLGCNGMMKLLLQKISRQENWQPFDRIAESLADSRMHNIALVTSESDPDNPAGSVFIDTNLPTHVDGVCWQTRPWARLLVLGAAPDAEPVIRLARQTGWSVTVADHRPHYLENNDFSMADQTVLITPGELSKELNPDAFNAVVIMSHHLETDGKYLRELADHNHDYIGLLGPAARKQKLLDMLEKPGNLAERLHGPVGLDIGADSPESIALALLAEIQSVLTGKQNA